MSIVRVERGIESLLDRRNVYFSVFHVGVVTMKEYGGKGEKQEEEIVSQRSHSLFGKSCFAHHFSS
jgi:hypothetical protein